MNNQMSEEFLHMKIIMKKLQRDMIKCRRNKARVIESSSSSSSDVLPSPSSQDPQDKASVVVTETPTKTEDPVAPASPKDNALNPLNDNPPPLLIEDRLEEELHQIFEGGPSASINNGPITIKELGSQLEHIASHGLETTQREELYSKYRIPVNCTSIAAPILNEEIKAALETTLIKKDKSLETKQNHLATVISCLASVMTEEFASTERNPDLLRKLMDASRILCDIQHTDSVTRRNSAMNAFKNEMKNHLEITKPGKYLFGDNLSVTSKTAKAVPKSGNNLKQQKISKRSREKSDPKTKNSKKKSAAAGEARRTETPPPQAGSSHQPTMSCRRNQPTTAYRRPSPTSKPNSNASPPPSKPNMKPSPLEP